MRFLACVLVALIAAVHDSPPADAAEWVCGPNGCYQVGSEFRTPTIWNATPVRSAGSNYRTQRAAAAYQTQRYVAGYGLLGRPIYRTRTVAAPTAVSYGSGGGYSSYSYGSGGGYSTATPTGNPYQADPDPTESTNSPPAPPAHSESESKAEHCPYCGHTLAAIATPPQAAPAPRPRACLAPTPPPAMIARHQTAEAARPTLATAPPIPPHQLAAADLRRRMPLAWADYKPPRAWQLASA